MESGEREIEKKGMLWASNSSRNISFVPPLSSSLLSPNPPLITCEGLVKIYRVAEREVVALQGLELKVGVGEILGIVGPSGAGKSTLMNIVGGLDRPSAGQVVVNGNSLADLSDAELDRYRQEQTGFVWQMPGRNLISYLSAWENVELPMMVSYLPARVRRERVTELLEAVGLSERAHHLPTQLSGGEQQRVAVAVALANRPRLLLADEPTGELDSITAKEIYRLFRTLNQAYGLTVIAVSHDPNIAQLVDRVITIRDGKTSTETRQVSDISFQTPDQIARKEPEEIQTEELVVLDSAGRLQVPKQYREEYGISDRVRLERMPEGILIQPAEMREQDEHND